MKKFLKEYFSYSRNEQRGLLVLIVLMFIFLIFPYVINLFKVNKEYDSSAFDQKIEAFENALSYNEKKEVEYFFFDPNELDFSGFLNLGLSKKQAYNIINYRKAGGYFTVPVDFKKIYSISDSTYLVLESYIKIKNTKNNEIAKGKVKSAKKKLIAQNKNQFEGNKEKQKNKSRTEYNVDENFSVDINKADSIDLIRLKGIGPVFAHRIINYRHYLGGYYSKTQLMEVYGFKKETYDNILPYLLVDTSLLVKLNLNAVSFKELNRHPYISYNQTKSLMNYRNLMKRFSRVEELLSNHLVDSITYFKVQPYLVAD